MIKIEEFKKLVKSNLDFGHYCLLYYLTNNIDISSFLSEERVKSSLNLLEKRGLVLYTGQYTITEKGIETFEGISSIEENKITPSQLLSIEKIYENLIAKLVDLTGKKQTYNIVQGDKYAFMITNVRDFKDRIEKVIKKYKIKDLVKLQNVLIAHIENCYSNNKWSPILRNYITHETRGSQMVSDYEIFDDEIIEKKKKTIYDDGVNL